MREASFATGIARIASGVKRRALRKLAIAASTFAQEVFCVRIANALATNVAGRELQITRENTCAAWSAGRRTQHRERERHFSSRRFSHGQILAEQRLNPSQSSR